VPDPTHPTQNPAIRVLPSGNAGGVPPSAVADGSAGASRSAPGRPAPPSREELERVRARDPQALGAFFERYFDRVYGLVFHLLGERAAAEDATQEVFLKVHRAAAQLDPARDPAPWLSTIAYNTCRDLWRSGAYRMSKRSASVEQDPAVTLRLSGGDDPERALLTAERERLVREAIAQLPEPLRAVVLLYDYQGLNHQEIADVLKVNHAAARKRYSRALAALGKRLREKLA
jgi:RNA polymerase sigma-70 factor, ECF subfamily